MHRAQILPSSGDLCLSVARCPPLKDGEFRFHCFGGARSSVLVRRTIPPCRLGYGILELLGLRHPCLAGKSRLKRIRRLLQCAASLSGREVACDFPVQCEVTRQLSFLLDGAHLPLRFGGSRQGIRKGDPCGSPFLSWLGASQSALTVQAD